MEQNIIILYARPWSMSDETTGVIRSGVTIYYVTSDKLDPKVSEDGTEHGYMPVKQSISVDLAKSLSVVPGVYNTKFEMRSTKTGVVAVPAVFECVGPVASGSKK